MTDDLYAHNAEQPKLEIEYPCQWKYRVIVADEAVARAAISAMLDGRDHELTTGNASRTGKYVSVELAMIVDDEEHRTTVLSQLQVMDGVRYVL